jgi:type 1 glutamine amidotransferase
VSERKALVVRGGWEGHQPVEATDRFIPHLEENGFQVRVEDSSKVYADAEYMAGVDLVMQCVTMSTIEKPELAGLTAAVANGTGLAGWHGGIADSYRNSSDYLHMIGGQFACHPPKAPEERRGEQADNYIPYRVEVTAPEHPITAGIADFDLVTEQYWVLTDAYNDVLATTTLDARPWDPWHRPVTSPAIWTREWGRGKVFVCTPGHNMDVLVDPNVTTLIQRGLLWAAR